MTDSPTEVITNALWRHYVDNGYNVDLYIGHPKGAHEIKFFSLKWKLIGVIKISETAIWWSTMNYTGPKLDYTDPESIDELDRTVARAMDHLPGRKRITEESQ